MLTTLRKFAAIIATLSIVGCIPTASLNDYTAIHQSAAKRIPVAAQMESLFGNSDHFVVNFNCSSSPQEWQTVTYFGGRYELTMSVKIQVNCLSKTVTQLSSPTFQINEIESVDREETGNPGCWYNPEKHRKFLIDDWNEVFESNGDWSVIGYSINKSPVPNFDVYVNAVRRDRILIKLSNNDPR